MEDGCAECEPQGRGNKRAVTHFFYAMLLLKEKEKLLLAVDSAYTVWVEKADRRYALGESNVLEKQLQPSSLVKYKDN